MKKKIFGGKAGKIWLGFNCLLIALVFWFAVKFVENGGLPIFMSIFG